MSRVRRRVEHPEPSLCRCTQIRLRHNCAAKSDLFGRASLVELRAGRTYTNGLWGKIGGSITPWRVLMQALFSTVVLKFSTANCMIPVLARSIVFRRLQLHSHYKKMSAGLRRVPGARGRGTGWRVPLNRLRVPVCSPKFIGRTRI
jgi:hypothetical protein